MELIKKFFCPVNAWDCPYWKQDGSCSMVDEGDDPLQECEDAGIMYDEDDDYFVYADEEGKVYDTQELLELGYHFVNGKPILDPALAPTMKIVAEILKSSTVGMQEIKIKNPNWDETVSFPPDCDEMATNGFRG